MLFSLRLPAPGNMVLLVGTRGGEMLPLIGHRGGSIVLGLLRRVTRGAFIAAVLERALKATLGCERDRHYLE